MVAAVFFQNAKKVYLYIHNQFIIPVSIALPKIVEKDSKVVEENNYDSIETSSTSEEEEDTSLQLQLLNQFPICDRFNKNDKIAKGSDFVF